MDLNLLLASSSPYRRQQLKQLGLHFEWQSPNIDESKTPDEAPDALAQRLGREKAKALAETHSNHIIIAGDQTAEIDGNLLTKPGSTENAINQLKACSGRTAYFYSSLCVLYPSAEKEINALVTTTVNFRRLSEAQISRYIEREKPLDCAGSFKCEGLGIALFQSIQSDDPSALIGLPLIALTTALQEMNIDVLI